MTAHSARISGLSALLTLSVALAGCGALDDDVTEAKPATPQETLLKAVPGSDTAAYEFEVKQSNQTLTGTYDAPKKAFDAKIVYSEPGDGVDLTLTMTALVRSEGNWVKIAFKPSNLPGLPKLSKKWMKLDPTKIKDASQSFLAFDEHNADPGNTNFLVMNAAAVTETGPGQYAGTTDISAAKDAEIVDDATLKALGDKANALPFTATVDAQGHLSAMTVKIPAAGKTKAATYTVKYSAFGQAAVPAAPAASAQTPAPAAAYDLLNS